MWKHSNKVFLDCFFFLGYCLLNVKGIYDDRSQFSLVPSVISFLTARGVTWVSMVSVPVMMMLISGIFCAAVVVIGSI